MAKLKFDRSINLKLKNDESVTVPDDEIWRAEAYDCKKLLVNGEEAVESSGGVQSIPFTFGGGVKLSTKFGVAVTGVAFKVIKEE